MSPKPVERTEQGIISWKLELRPGEKKVIDYEFWIRHPQDMDIAGM